MIEYDKETKTVTMSLVDLEHCGFSHEEYLNLLFCSGFDISDENLDWPDKVIVIFPANMINDYELEKWWCDKCTMSHSEERPGDCEQPSMDHKINIRTAREIAARIWCDPEMEHVEMDAELVEEIALLISENIERKSSDE